VYLLFNFSNMFPDFIGHLHGYQEILLENLKKIYTVLILDNEISMIYLIVIKPIHQ